MKKTFFLLVLAGIGIGVLVGYLSGPKGDPLAELLPATTLNGYIEGTQVAIMANAKGRSITGGALLMAEGWAPAGISDERLLPTIYGALKAVLQQNRQAEVVRLYLAEDSLLARAYQWAAMAEYRRGRVTVTGGFPSVGQIDSLKSLGFEARRPSAAEARAIAAVFDRTNGLGADRLEVSQSLSVPRTGPPPAAYFDLPLETKVLSAVSKEHGLKAHELRETLLAVNRFYWLKAGQILAVRE
jgi:hypothetical protein